MKKLFIVLLLLLSFICITAFILNGFRENDFYSDIKRTAKDALPEFLNYIPEGFESQYGFNSRNEFSMADIGNVYEVYTISTDFLSMPGTDLKLFVKPIEQFRVEVIVNNEVRTFVNVSKVNDKYKVVDLGGAELSKEFERILKDARDVNPRRIIFRLFQAECDFLATTSNFENAMTGGKEIESFNFYATLSSRIIFRNNNLISGKIYSFTELEPLIREKYSETVNEGGVK